MRAAIFLAGLALIAAMPAAASSVISIYAFEPVTEGSFPNALVAAPDGRVFGELKLGPKGSSRGVVFELDPPSGGSTHWKEQTIFQLLYQNVFSGEQILRAANGHLFLATADTGATTSYTPCIIWELSPPQAGGSTWTAAIRADDPHVGGMPLTYLYLHYVDSSSVLYGYGALGERSSAATVVTRFAPLSTDPSRYLPSILATACPPSEPACGPPDTLLLGEDGSFYAASDVDLFRIVPPAVAGGAWTRQSLVAATDETVLAADRSLTLFTAGGSGSPGGGATVNRFSPPTYSRSVLLDPPARHFGSFPDDLAQDRTGLLFGILADSNAGCCGAVFRVGPQLPTSGTLLHVFSGPDGDIPERIVTSHRPDGSRVFFGFTLRGGVGWTGVPSTGAGTVFEIVP